jgi:transposase
MTQDELAQLSRDELIQLILTLYQQNVALQADIAQLKADNEALRLKLEKGKKPPTNSSNSSQPPSRDHKRSLPTDRRKRRHGPPAGHPRHERQFVAKPDHIVEVKAETCRRCHADLHSAEGVLQDVNQISELPPAKVEVIEVRQYEVRCPECGKLQVGEPPAGLEMERAFGARLEATVVYYRQEQHISYQRTQAAMLNLHGVEISQGGIDKIMQRAGNKALQEVEPIQASVRQSAVIHSDETGSRVDGQNWVEPTNNRSERALRPSVIHRKVIGCFRSGWGARAYAALASVIDTAELNGVQAFDAILSLCGLPSLPLPSGP